MSTLTSVTKNMWGRRESGLISPVWRRSFPINGCVLYAPLWHPDWKGSPFNAWDIATPGTHVCTKTGTTWGSTGLTMDGDDCVSVADSNSLDITTAITCIVWVKFTSLLSNPFLIDKAYTTSYYLQATAGGALEFGGNSGATSMLTSAASKVTTATWYMITGQYDTTIDTINSYVNTTLAVTSTNRTGTIGANTNALVLGAVNAKNNFFLNGIMGEVWVHNRFLRLAEITQTHNGTKWHYGL